MCPGKLWRQSPALCDFCPRPHLQLALLHLHRYWFYLCWLLIRVCANTARKHTQSILLILLQVNTASYQKLSDYLSSSMESLQIVIYSVQGVTRAICIYAQINNEVELHDGDRTNNGSRPFSFRCVKLSGTTVKYNLSI